MELEQLIIGETYFTKFGSLGIQKLKLIKILRETLHNNIVKVIVSSFPKKANDEYIESWQLWSDEIFCTSGQAKNKKSK